MALDSGSGKDKTTRFYYKADDETCMKFAFKGDGGNANDFETKEACLAACGGPAPGKFEFITLFNLDMSNHV